MIGKPTIENIVHGSVSRISPPSIAESVDSICAGLPGARRDMIYAIVKQERPTGQTDFFIGKEFRNDEYKPIILFERHVFYRCLEKYGKEHGVEHLAKKILDKFPNDKDILEKTLTPHG